MNRRTDTGSARPLAVGVVAAALVAAGAGTAFAVTAPAGSAASSHDGGRTTTSSLLAGSYTADYGRLSGDQTNGRVKNTELPSVTGTATVGQSVKADQGEWQPNPDSVTFQWFVDGQKVRGATNAKYTPGADDKGADLTVEVTAAAEGKRPGTATSEAVTVKGARVESTKDPVLKGKAQVGSTLSVSGGRWSTPGVTVTYQWYRDGQKVRGGTGTSYAPKRSDVGSRFWVVVTATKAGFHKGTAKTAKSDKVVKGH